jgi:predicted ATPase/DNA-binding winged helix-turn-helix (wHTH) protein
MISIGPLQVDLARRELFRDGELVRLGSRAFDMLAALIAANGKMVSKDEILRLVWPDTVVEVNNLQVQVSALRKALGESRDLIRTVSGRGYRLVMSDSSAVQAKTGDDDEVDSTRDALPRRRVANNLPSNFGPLIGREQAMDDIALALASTRHVTLVGSGGIGKTRLAIEVARRLIPLYSDGVYLVSLASTSCADSVLAMFAASIGVSEAPALLTLSRVSAELRERRVLVILDNCEHVLGAAAELAETLLSSNLAASILATSREPLRVVDERLYWVASLDVPNHDDQSQEVLQRSAVTLFLTRAHAVDARFSSDERSIHLTGMICRRLDGIPLAIELAAARAAILGIETLADRLDDRFDMLTGGSRTALPRHQTLKATLDWSHALLDGVERTTLRGLGIFVNSFTLEAAIAVVINGAVRESEVIAAVSGLVEKSLVATSVEHDKARFRLLETTRAYALQKLDDNGERHLVALSHARFFTGLLERVSFTPATSASGLAGPRVRGACEFLDDLRAALNWALSPNGDKALGVTLAVKVASLLYELSLVKECCVWARRALDTVVMTHRDSRSSHHLRARMQLLAALGAAHVYVNGPNRETFSIWPEVLALAIALGDQAFEARALWGMWNACQSFGAARNALSYAHRFASFASERGDVSGMMLGYRLLGIAAHYTGDQQQARLSLEHFLSEIDGFQHRLPLGQSIDQRVVGRATLARVLWLQGLRDQALALAEDCVADACIQDQAIVTCYVLIEAEIPLALLSGKRERAAKAIALLQNVSGRAGLCVSQACCSCFDEYLRSLDETGPERLHAFRMALNQLALLEYGAPRAMFAAQYALALGRAGQCEQGIATIMQALTQCDENGDRWFAAELQRVHGDLLLAAYENELPVDSLAMEAETYFVAAYEESLAQGSHSLQLRAATSLGRLWHAQGRIAEAIKLLDTACTRLTEGFDSSDFEAASQMLRIAIEARELGEISIESETFGEADASVNST